MAANQYYDSNSGDPNQTDTSNGAGDWWTQNAPAAPAAAMTQAVAPSDSGIAYWKNGYGYDSQGNVVAMGEGTDPTTGYQGQIANSPVAPAPTTGGDPGVSFGGPIAPFQYNPSGSGYPTFTPPPLPDALQKGFQLPTAADLQATPGYMARYQQGLDTRQRSAAAHGTILNGGTQKALDRYGQDYASNEYGNLVSQKLNERQQQSADYLNLAYGPAWQSNQAAVNQYGTLYGQYKDLIGNNRTAQNDYWQQQMDLLNAGLGAAKSGNPGSTGAQG